MLQGKHSLNLTLFSATTACKVAEEKRMHAALVNNATPGLITNTLHINQEKVART